MLIYIHLCTRIILLVLSLTRCA